MKTIHYPVLFWIKPKISQSFKRESYVLIITLSIKDRRLQAILQWSRIQGCKRNILGTAFHSAHIMRWMWLVLP